MERPDVPWEDESIQGTELRMRYMICANGETVAFWMETGGGTKLCEDVYLSEDDVAENPERFYGRAFATIVARIATQAENMERY